jgi:multidrug transporter EmrE-like cation transporter
MGVIKTVFFHWLLVVLAGINSCAGNVLLKYSRKGAAPGFLGFLFNPWFIAGLLFYAVNVVLFAKALDSLPVSRAYPVLSGLGFVLLTAASSLLFGEALNVRGILGIVLVFAGIVLLAG